MEKAKNIRLLILDVDGVLTDGKIIYTSHGEEIKAFHVKDEHGLKLLKRVGIEAAFITGRTSPIVLRRAEELGVSMVYQKALEKKDVLQEILKEGKYIASEIAYMGDDLVDLPVLKQVGLSATVADGVEELKREVDFVSSKKGGEGAVREFIELILKAQGQWEGVIKKYLG